ncbi:MAG TPA: glycerate kinase [Verrucomicrobiales bacterium]|nr:glycerate kinase [Verrucomicrobiales bacterium]
MRVLVAFDKFKGSLSATEACQAAARGLARAKPFFDICQVPVADGGEGTVQGVAASLPGRIVHAPVVDALGRPIDAPFFLAIDSPSPFAVLEMAAAAGLEPIPPGLRDPLRATTRGVGQLIRAAQREGAHTILAGLGGSATNDGGAGLAAALGYHFLDSQGNALDPLPLNLHRVASIVPPTAEASPPLPFVVALADVTNPLLGPQGATAVFGPQKGVSPALEPLLESALAHLANQVAASLKCDFRDAPGAGAAGGCGFGLLAFLGARIESGFERIAQITGLEEAMRACDWVITGEGRLDHQTLLGKAPAGVAAMARRLGKPVHAIGGSASAEDLSALGKHFDSIHLLQTEGIALETALRDAAQLLEDLSETLGAKLQR